jgi:uncharacterized membrane-anchored protein
LLQSRPMTTTDFVIAIACAVVVGLVCVLIADAIVPVTLNRNLQAIIGGAVGIGSTAATVISVAWLRSN